jgi:hypothetical protein
MKRFLLRLLLAFAPARRIPTLADQKVGLVLLTSHEDAPLLAVALHSFYWSLGDVLPCLVFDDGSLTGQDKRWLTGRFPGIAFTQPDSMKTETLHRLQRYPFSLKKRQTESYEKMNNMRRIKFFDLFLSTPFEKSIFFDSDVLFFHKPRAIAQWVHSRKTQTLYACERIYDNRIAGEDPCWTALSKLLRERINPKIRPEFNSGLLCFSRSLYRLDRFEEVLNYIYQVGLEETWAAGQFVLSALVAESRNQDLGKRYIHLRTSWEALRAIKESVFVYTFIHFSFLSKSYFFPAAILLLVRRRFFRVDLSEKKA